MIRHLKILDYALSSLVRRKYKNAAIILVYSFTIAVLASILFLTHALKTEAENILVEAPDLVIQRTFAGRHDLIPKEYAEEIKNIRGIENVKPRYWGYYYDSFTKSNYTMLGLASKISDLKMLEGVMISRPGECVIGEGVSKARLTGIGDDLILIDSQGMGVVFEVVGKFSVESELLTNDLIVLSDADLIGFFGFPPGKSTDIAVEVFNENEIQNIAGKIKKIFPDTRPITKQEIVRTYNGVFNWRSGMMLTLFSAALASFIILAWDKATGLSGEEKHEIGILKSIGWDTADILELKFWEGLIISFTAFLLGITVAFVHVFYLEATILASVMKGWSVLFPNFRLIPFVDIYQIIVIGFLTVVPYVASTVVPSWKAAITDPDSVMRG